MKASKLILVLTLLFSTISGTLLVNLVKANPLYEKRWANSPIISLYSPSNNQTFYSNEIPLNFTVTKPGQYEWLIKGGSEEARNLLLSINIVLDNILYRSIEVNSNLSSSFSYFETLTNLTDGAHNLTIQTVCEGWDVEVHGIWANKFIYENSSDLTAFTVAKPESLELSPTAIVATASGISVTIIAAGLLVFFKKRKH